LEKTLTILIDNNEYVVAANDTDKIISASNFVNNIIQECKNSFIENSSFSQLDTITFAALNIAEQQINDKIYYENQIENATNEINKITEYMNNILEKN